MTNVRVPFIARLLTVVAALALFAAACGGGESDTVAEVVEAGDVAGSSDDAADAEASSDEQGASADPSSDEAEEEMAEEEMAEDEADDEDEAEDEESLEEAIEAATEGDEYASPLADFLGFPTGGNEQEQQLALSRQIEESVQLCMRSEGFEYTAQDVAATAGIFGGDFGADLSEDEYIDTYGYGISTTFEESFELQTSYVDPNQELTDAMSEGERDAWNFALRGVEPDIDETTGLPIDPETGEPTSDFSVFLDSGGCYNNATQEVFGNISVLFELSDKFEEIEDRFFADARIIEVTGEWATCMAEASYPFDRPGDPEEDIGEQFQTWAFATFATVGPDDELPELTSEQTDELDELQDYERAVARADFDCDSGFREISPEVQAEYELQFIDENRAVLETARPDN